MNNKELLNSYKRLLNKKINIEEQLRQLPDGYLSKKNIAGKTYTYLQKKNGSKIVGSYVKLDDVASVNKKLESRNLLKLKSREIDVNLAKIEAAAKILSPSLYHHLMVAKRCASMDNMPLESRPNTLNFANAMTALEGIPATEETNRHLVSWANGHQNFSSGYLKTLEKYNLIEG